MPEPVVFDHTSPDIAGPQFWDGVRELVRHGPVVRVESVGGYWAATSFDTVLRVAQDWQTFTSAEGVSHPRPSPDVYPYTLPIDFDPPRQRHYRKRVNPHLSPRAVGIHEDAIRAIADELVDTFADQGSCDIVREFARKFPGTVFFRLVVRCSDEDFYEVEPSARDISFESDPEKVGRGAALMREWAARVFDERADLPADHDIATAVMHTNDDGEQFVDYELTSGLQILASGGIGTSSNAIGATMRILCENAALQERVRRDLTLVPALMEESLRLEPPLPIMFRTAARDVELGGQQIAKGDKVAMFIGAANRDPAVFERPEEFDIDRPHNRHLTFGGGHHRCIGSNLARLQIRVALEQLISRLSPFRIREDAEISYYSLQARGPSSIPIELARAAAGQRAGAEASGREPGIPASSEPWPERPGRRAESGKE